MKAANSWKPGSGLAVVASLVALGLTLGIVSADLAMRDEVTDQTESATFEKDLQDRVSDDPSVSLIATGPGKVSSSSPGAEPLAPPLPSAALPLAAQLPIIEDRARRGDAVAMCRLILSKAKCTTEAARRDFASRATRSLEAEKRDGENVIIEHVARAEEQLAGSGSFCSGVDSGRLPSADDVLSNHLGALSPRQKTVIALMRSDGSLRRLRASGGYSESSSYLLPQVIADNAYDFLMSGYNAQEPLALEGLILVHAPGAAIMSQGVSIRLPNPKLFLRYALLYVNLFGIDALGEPANRLLAATLSQTDADDYQVLRKEIEQEARRWQFVKRQLPLERAQNDATSDSQAEALLSCDT